MSSEVSPEDAEERKLKENDVILETEPTNEDNSSPVDNILGKDLQSVLKPMNMMLDMFFCSKYRIRNNIISSNSVFYDIISIVASVTFLLGFFYCTLGTFSINFYGFEYVLQLSKWYTFSLFVFLNILKCCANIIQKRSNMLFVLRVHDIYRILEINESFKHFIIPNWASVITLNCFHIFWMFYSYFMFRSMGFTNIFISYCFICVDMYILDAICLTKLLTKPLKNWVKMVQKSQCVQNSQNDCYWKTMYKVYVQILEAYKIFEKTTRAFVRII